MAEVTVPAKGSKCPEIINPIKANIENYLPSKILYVFIGSPAYIAISLSLNDESPTNLLLTPAPVFPVINDTAPDIINTSAPILNNTNK